MPCYEAVVGIDPGLKGALVVLDTITGICLQKITMPDNFISTHDWLKTLKAKHPTIIVAFEKPQTVLGRTSMKGAFTSGRNFGAIEACIRLLGIPMQMIPPTTWQAEFHKGADGPGPKEKSLSVAKALWPCEKFTVTEKQIKPLDGIVDAMLVAEFLRRRVR